MATIISFPKWAQKAARRINSDMDALTIALTLAISAPDEERKERCVKLAAGYAARLTPAQITEAEERALAFFQKEEA